MVVISSNSGGQNSGKNNYYNNIEDSVYSMSIAQHNIDGYERKLENDVNNFDIDFDNISLSDSNGNDNNDMEV